mmetsp:Transcript_13789/g.33225  ORF Transcript_13789/g.33225 Transcript_13789/m.33225 type:complete len:441 (-) Transcript_13789:106-1428(-)
MAPMICGEPQNLTRGMRANGSWKKRMTEERMMRYSAYSSPAMMTTRSEGTMAAERVRNARSTGLIRISRKPSITNCPAYVPVMVELCPDASSAAANRLFAAPPSTSRSMSGVFCSGRSTISCFRSPVGSMKLALAMACAATMTMAKLMNRQMVSASADSATLYLSASRRGFSPNLKDRDSTRAECRKRLWGMTTAPSSEMAMNRALPSGMIGTTIPVTTCAASPPSSIPTCATKHTDMIPTRTPMNASSLRTPKLCRPRNTRVDSEVTATPTTVESPKMSFRASAVPITSGTSDAMMASSVTTQSAYLTGVGYSSRMQRARCQPVASARRTLSAWMYRPHRVAHSSTHSSLYPNSTPACRSLSKLPGSMYPMHIRNPGPTKPANLRQLQDPSSPSMPSMTTSPGSASFDPSRAALPLPPLPRVPDAGNEPPSLRSCCAPM